MKITYKLAAVLAGASLLLSSCISDGGYVSYSGSVGYSDGYTSIGVGVSGGGYGSGYGASAAWSNASYDANGFPIFGYSYGQPVYGYTAAGAAIFSVAALTALCFVPHWKPAPWYRGSWHYPANIHRVASPPRCPQGHMPHMRPQGGLNAPIHRNPATVLHPSNHGVGPAMAGRQPNALGRPGINAPGQAGLNRPGINAPGHAGLNRPGINAPGHAGLNRPGINAPGQAGLNRPGVNAPGQAGLNRPGINAPGQAGLNRPGVNAPGQAGLNRPGVNAPGHAGLNRPGIARPQATMPNRPVANVPMQGGVNRPGIARPQVSAPNNASVMGRPAASAIGRPNFAASGAAGTPHGGPRR